MDIAHFDALTRSISTRLSRRTLTGALGLGMLGLAGSVEAKRKRRKRKNKMKVKKNAFGCVSVGSFCQNDEQCCSGICDGRKGQQKCGAHDTRGCQPADDSCLEEGDILCPDDAGRATKAVVPFCFQTTGQAGVCGFRVGNQCVACTKDADCVTDFGDGAACVVCPKFCADSNHTTCIPAEF